MFKNIFCLVMSIGMFGCTTLPSWEKTAQNSKGSRWPAGTANMSSDDSMAVDFGKSKDSRALQYGDVTIDFSNCNEQTIYRGSKEAGPDKCYLSFKNTFLFLKDKSQYGATYSANSSMLEIDSNRVLLFFDAANLKADEIKTKTQKILNDLCAAHASEKKKGQEPLTSCNGSKLTLNNVTFIKL
jgi:hypothetical protein